MQVLYTNEYMATHSLTGAKSSTSRDKAVKPAMNQNEVQEIIGDNMTVLYCHMNLELFYHSILLLSDGFFFQIYFSMEEKSEGSFKLIKYGKFYRKTL